MVAPWRHKANQRIEACEPAHQHIGPGNRGVTQHALTLLRVLLYCETVAIRAELMQCFIPPRPVCVFVCVCLCVLVCVCVCVCVCVYACVCVVFQVM